jgi:hypothetical protein
MQPKSKKTFFTLKISVLILLVLFHFVTQEGEGLAQLTQLLQNYNLNDKLIEIGNALSNLI